MSSPCLHHFLSCFQLSAIHMSDANASCKKCSGFAGLHGFLFTLPEEVHVDLTIARAVAGHAAHCLGTVCAFFVVCANRIT